MRSFWANPATPDYPPGIHPALSSFADECAAILAHLAAYLGALALLAAAGLHFWNELPDAATTEPAAAEATLKPTWSLASRSYPAFAVSSLDIRDKTETYEIFRHPEGGRKDVLHWMTPGAVEGEKPVAELEIYRPGGEYGESEPAGAEIAARMDPQGAYQGDYQGSHGLEAAGSSTANSAGWRCCASRARPTRRRPASASSSSWMIPFCKYPAGAARAVG